MDEQPVRFIQFRNDGKVRVYTAKRPPVGQGPVIKETLELKRLAQRVPYNKWRLDKTTGEVITVENSERLAAVFVPEDKPLPGLEPEAKALLTRYSVGLIAAAAAGAALSYLVVKLLAGSY